MWFRRATDDNEEATEALKDATKNLRETKRRGKEVSMVANALKELRERDRFGEELEEILFRSEG
jgi:hypothetical protein